MGSFRMVGRSKIMPKKDKKRQTTLRSLPSAHAAIILQLEGYFKTCSCGFVNRGAYTTYRGIYVEWLDIFYLLFSCYVWHALSLYSETFNMEKSLLKHVFLTWRNFSQHVYSFLACFAQILFWTCLFCTCEHALRMWVETFDMEKSFLDMLLTWRNFFSTCLFVSCMFCTCFVLNMFCLYMWACLTLWVKTFTWRNLFSTCFFDMEKYFLKHIYLFLACFACFVLC